MVATNAEHVREKERETDLIRAQHEETLQEVQRQQTLQEEEHEQKVRGMVETHAETVRTLNPPEP